MEIQATFIDGESDTELELEFFFLINSIDYFLDIAKRGV